MRLFKESLLLLIFYFVTAFSDCPQTHPYAYINGSYCCKTEREANRPDIGDNPPCDGGRLEYKSRCCEGDKYLPCPTGGSSCKSTWDTALTATLDYPYNMRHLCYVNGNLAKIIPWGPDSESAWVCRDNYFEEQLTEDGDNIQEEWQMFDKATNQWVTRTANQCWYEVAEGQVWCLGIFATDVEIASSTGGSTRAKAKAPASRSCGDYGMGKWKRIKGKLKCVFIPLCPGKSRSQSGYVWMQKNGYKQRECDS